MEFEDKLKQAEDINKIYFSNNYFLKFFYNPFKYTYYQGYKILKLHSNVRVRAFWNSQLTLPLWDENAALIYMSGALGFNESALTHFMLQNITSQDIFYDIGSNIGFYASLAEALGARVHAFEPNPSTVEYVRANAPQAIVNQVAVANQEGEMEFYDIALSNKSGMSSLFQESIPALNKKTQVVRKVRTITLDNYVKVHTPPTIMKLDVEDAESLVLQGGKELLTQYAPTILMEIDKRPDSLSKTNTALALLSAAHYRAFDIQLDGSLKEVTMDIIRMSHNVCFKK